VLEKEGEHLFHVTEFDDIMETMKKSDYPNEAKNYPVKFVLYDLYE